MLIVWQLFVCLVFVHEADLIHVQLFFFLSTLVCHFASVTSLTSKRQMTQSIWCYSNHRSTHTHTHTRLMALILLKQESEWQWHQLGRMQICTSLQTNNHASTPPLSFLKAGCSSCCPINSVKALKACINNNTHTHTCVCIKCVDKLFLA